MTFKEYRFLVYSDLYRMTGSVKTAMLLRSLLLGEGFKYSFWMRTCTYTRSKPFLRYTVFPFAKVLLVRYRYKLGIYIPPETKIGSGLYIGHFGGIFVNKDCVIGKNLNISQGVSVGQTNRGKYKGCPVLGDNIYIGPGAKVNGGIKIGNNVAIGANCVVTRDVPDNAVVVGVPGKVISQEGSIGYVNHTDYEDKIR